ncbi:MAG: EamA family transporter [Rhodospirillales bacterium]|nr:EamA family transporter [Rhodospirillales bacterium]
MNTDRQLLGIFLLVSAIWGSTWLATKIGVQIVPPLFFSASRLVAAGAILLVFAASRGSITWPKGRGLRIVGLSVMVATIPYAAIFWGVLHAPSGLAAVVNLSLMPLSLFVIGLMFGEENYSHRKAIGVAIGILGLVVLFAPKLMADTLPESLWGLAVIAAGTVCYCFAAVIIRPLLKQGSPMVLSGWFLTFGGCVLVLIAIAMEPIGLETLFLFARVDVLLSWLYLAIGGMVIGFSLFTRLVRDWGPSRAGLYAFVSPVIAVILGVLVLDESFGTYEIVGGIIMLSAAGLVITPSSTERATA